VDTKKKKNTGVLITTLITLILLFSSIQFDCAPPPTTETTTEISDAKADSIRLAELKNQLMYDYSFGYEYYKNQEYAKALPRLLRANKIDAELNKEKLQYDAIYGYIAYSYIQLEKPDSALWAYQAGVQYKPNDPSMHLGLINIYTQQQNVEGLIEEYKILSEIVEDKEQKIDYLNALKAIFMNRNDIENALGIYDKLLEVDPENKTYIDDRLTLLKSTGNDEMYIQDLENKLTEYPEDTNYMWSLILEYENRNENDKVIAMADKMLALEPENLEALQKKAHAFANKVDYRNVVNIYNEMLKVKPNEKSYFVEIANAYQLLKNYPTARTFVNRALRVDRNYGAAYHTLGNIYEACAEDVVREKGGYQKLSFDDKLVYQLAYDQYEKAAADFETERNARRKMSNLQNFLPTNSDKFMHPNQTEARGDEYAWIYK